MTRAFTVIDAPQRSPEWRKIRAGRLTASVADAVTAKGRNGEEAVTRRDLRLRLVCERLTGEPQEDGYQNGDMLRGIELEPAAFAAYEALTGEVAHRVGFCAGEDMTGCSPDGMVDDGVRLFVGVVELKCPKSATHLGYLRAGVLPTTYVPQVTHTLWVTGAAWCDFLSFDPRFPPALQTFLIRVHRADLDIDGYAKKALAFLDEETAETEAVRTLADTAGQLRASLALRG